ncbi:hypothetical protein BGZ80_007202, partial [Entomortierella chlamydospora]
MSDPATTATVMQEELCIEEKGSSHIALVHGDSELTITADHKPQLTGEKDLDIEHASATADLEEPPMLVDGPPYGWVVVFASFFTQMISMGTCNVYGVFQ